MFRVWKVSQLCEFWPFGCLVALLYDVQIFPCPKNGISIGVKEGGYAINTKTVALLPVVIVVLCGQCSPVNHLMVLHKEVVTRVYNDTPESKE